MLLGTFLIVCLTALALFAGAVVGLRRLARTLGAEELANELPPHLARALEDDAPSPSASLSASPSASPSAPMAADGRTAAACPRCTTALADIRGAYDERRCPRTCGTLLPLTGSERLFERAGLDAEVVRALVSEQGAKKATCPSCDATMREGRLRGVVVDLCLSCGALWLDDGELEKLTGARAFEGVA